MVEDSDSLWLRVRERAEAAPGAPALGAFGRRWRYDEVLARSGRIAAALARLEVGPRRPLGLLLPPVPTAAMATLAAFRLGAVVVPCDPLGSADQLSRRLGAVSDGVLLTLDLTRLQRRWVDLAAQSGLHAVVVEKMSELLPFPRSLLMPLLRGGEIAAVPRGDRVAALPALLRPDSRISGAAPCGAPALLAAAGGRIGEGDVLLGVDALLALAGGARRWLLAHHLDDAWSLSALLAPLTAGREVVALPRLDRRTVVAALGHEQPQVAVLSGRLVEELAGSPLPEGALDLAVVPPHVAADVRDALARASGCRVVAWAGPCRGSG